MTTRLPIAFDAPPPFAMPILAQTDPLDRAIADLQKRKAKLLELAKLQEEVAALQLRSLGACDEDKRTARRAIQIVANHFGITEADLLGKSRRQNITTARHLLRWIVRNTTRMSLQQIGEMTPARRGAVGPDAYHGTVIHSIQCVNDRASVDAKFAATANELFQKVKQFPQTLASK